MSVLQTAAEIDPLLVAQPEWFQRTIAQVEVRLET